MSILVEKPGMLTTVQDLGRKGRSALGIPSSGVMDWLSARLANALLANDPAAALLECHFPAPQLMMQQPSLITICGGDFDARADGRSLLLNRPYFLEEGTTIKFLRKLKGERVYIAVAGGIQVPPVLGSRSTQLDAGFGGYQGRVLKAGDLLPAHNYHVKNGQHKLGWYAIPPSLETKELRVLPGPEWNKLTIANQERVLSAKYTVTASSSRMGVYWQTDLDSLPEFPAMLSSPVMTGTTQLFPDGSLVTLMADAQTVGGYPRLFQVIKADLPLLAQASPGKTFRLSMITVDHALDAMASLEQYLERVYAASLFCFK